ncbi:HAD-IIIC family phosphatase [Flavobacteriaceae bacterium]|nr:HAD-IIIC family phosphatase [Flavobacteriaceae bacterium]
MDSELRSKFKDIGKVPSYMSYLGLNNEIEKLKTSIEKEKIKISFLRNYTVEPILPILKCELFKSGFLAEFYLSDFDTIASDTLNTENDFYDFNSDLIILTQWLRLLSEKITSSLFKMSEKEREDETLRIINQFRLFLNGIRANCDTPIIVNNFPLPKHVVLGILDHQTDYSERKWYNKLNESLIELCQEIPNVYCLNLEAIFNSVGIENAFESRKWESSKSPFTFSALLPLAKEYDKYMRAIFGKTKKCLILDCDNTLWGGVIGEDGIDGIKIGGTYPGSSFQFFQQQILNLNHRGIILAVCSKNNEQDVIDVFENHEQMKLRLSDFISFKVNWEDKATNIQSIANELNIGLDSIVFMDDSEFECDWVSTQLPEVTVLHLEGEPVNYSSRLFEEGYFDSLSYIEADKNKTDMYKAEAKRKQLHSNANSYEEYLKSLDLHVNIEKGNKKNVDRISQLTQKTNQFNLTTKRYTPGQIEELIYNNDYDIFTMQAYDKVADLGIIASSIILHQDEYSVIDSLMMSCRALGRGLENAFLTYIIESSKKRNKKIIRGVYIPTNKNKQTEDFYKKNNLKRVDQIEKQIIWELDLTENTSKNYPNWITINANNN